MTRSPIHLETSSTGVVVYCDLCPHWRSFRFTKPEAWDSACEHEKLTHPADKRQRTARRVRRHAERHADCS
ncbi:hypothetical protein [Microbacterium sp.]|uniref:hypothetical protein n=1 Tax=Microbacterium sp. TaxID=51671 RepID=UPI003A91EA3B